MAAVYPRSDAWRPGYCVVHLLAAGEGKKFKRNAGRAQGDSGVRGALGNPEGFCYHHPKLPKVHTLRSIHHLFR